MINFLDALAPTPRVKNIVDVTETPLVILIQSV